MRTIYATLASFVCSSYEVSVGIVLGVHKSIPSYDARVCAACMFLTILAEHEVVRPGLACPDSAISHQTYMVWINILVSNV